MYPEKSILGKRQNPEGQSQISSLAETRKLRLVESIEKVISKYGSADLEGARQVFNLMAKSKVGPVHSEAWPAFGLYNALLTHHADEQKFKKEMAEDFRLRSDFAKDIDSKKCLTVWADWFQWMVDNPKKVHPKQVADFETILFHSEASSETLSSSESNTSLSKNDQ